MHNWPQTSESLILRLNDRRASESLLDGQWAIRFSDCPTDGTYRLPVLPGTTFVYFSTTAKICDEIVFPVSHIVPFRSLFHIHR